MKSYLEEEKKIVNMNFDSRTILVSLFFFLNKQTNNIYIYLSVEILFNDTQ